VPNDPGVPFPRDYYIAIKRYAASPGNDAQMLELMSNTHKLLTHVEAGYSLAHPADSKNAGMVSVGAVTGVPGFANLAPYSSQGPTSDGTTRKPDLVAPSEVANATWDTFFNAPFNGTSAAAPHVTGVAALIKQQNPTWTPQQIKAFLLNEAEGLGANPPNNQFGHGRVDLGPTPPYPSAVLQDNPIGYWRFSEFDNAVPARDLSASQKHGTVVGDVARGAPGALLNEGTPSMTFNGGGGSAGYVTIPEGFANLQTGLTIEAWVNPSAVADNARIVDFGRGAYLDNIILGRVGTSNDLKFEVATGSSLGGLVVAPGVLAPDGQWHHVVATLDALGNATLYYDGRVVAVGRSALPANVARTYNYIGRSNTLAHAPYQGGLDEVALYSAPLTEARVRAHYTASGRVPPPVPVPTAYQQSVLDDAPMAYWGLGDPAGSLVARDLTPAGRHAALVGGAVPQADGATPGDGAIAFDGANDHVALPAGFSAFPNGLTVEAWVYPTAFQNWQRIADIARGQASDNIILAFNGTSNDIHFDILRGNQSTGALVAAGYLQLNRWQHVAATVDANGLATIYHDGRPVRVGQLAISPANPIPNVVRTKGYLGRSNWASDQHYAGRIDEVAIHGAALTPARVAARVEASGRALPPLPPSNAWRGSYYANVSFIGNPASVPPGDPIAVHADDGNAAGNIDLNWGSGAPDPAVPADYFSVRWERTVAFDATCVRFHTFHNDGMRVHVDGKEVAWSWSDQNGTDRFYDVCAGVGEHVVRVDYYDRTGTARALFRRVPADVAGAIVPDGGVVALDLTVGQNAALTFEGAAGQRVSLGLWSWLAPGCCGNGAVTITRPNPTPGQPPITVAGPITFNSTLGGTFVNVVTLPRDDTYAVMIDPAGVNSGRVDVRLYDVPADLEASVAIGGTAALTIPNHLDTGDPGRNARLTFTGTGGQRVRLLVWSDLAPIAPKEGASWNYQNAFLSITWVNPATGQVETVMGATAAHTATNPNTLGPVTLPAAAPAGTTFTVIIDPNRSNAGNIAVTLTDVP
jgi:hypothetical protein